MMESLPLKGCENLKSDLETIMFPSGLMMYKTPALDRLTSSGDPDYRDLEWDAGYSFRYSKGVAKLLKEYQDKPTIVKDYDFVQRLILLSWIYLIGPNGIRSYPKQTSFGLQFLEQILEYSQQTITPEQWKTILVYTDEPKHIENPMAVSDNHIYELSSILKRTNGIRYLLLCLDVAVGKSLIGTVGEIW